MDGLRALLALWVVAVHILSWSGYYESKLPPQFLWYWAEFISGPPPVETFMILSGFAISFLLNNRPITYAEFMTGRFFRIYPVYAFCLVLGILTSLLVPDILERAEWRTIYFDGAHMRYLCENANFSGQVFWHFTLLNGLFPPEMLPCGATTFIAPGWSMTLEWQFYLLAPLIALTVRSGIGILVLLVFCVLGAYSNGYVNYQDAFLPYQLPLFLIGIGSYHLYAWYCRAGHPRSRYFALPVAALITFAVLTQWHPLPLIIWAVAFGCIFARENDVLSRALGLLRSFLLLSWLQRIGRMSYSLYLIHWPLILVVLWLCLKWQPSLTTAGAATWLFLAGLPLILLSAALIHYLIELPFMAIGKRLAGRQQWWVAFCEWSLHGKRSTRKVVEN